MLLIVSLQVAAEDIEEDMEERSTATGNRRIVNRKLLDYLRLFAKFVNPKSLYQQDKMAALYMELLSKSDKDIQVCKSILNASLLGVVCQIRYLLLFSNFLVT